MMNTTPRLSALSVQALEVTIEEVEYLIAELQLTDPDSASVLNMHAFDALNALHDMQSVLRCAAAVEAAVTA